MNKNIYLVNYPCMPLEHLTTSWENNERSKPFNELTKAILQNGFNCILCDSGWKGDFMRNPHAVILLNSDLSQDLLDNLSRLERRRSFLIILEPPNMARFMPHYNPSLSNWFGTIFTLFDEIVDHRTYLKLYHWQARSRVVEDEIPFESKKFCTMVQSCRTFDHPDSLFEERKRIALEFAKDEGFELYGMGWDGYRSWKGPLDLDKLELLKQHKFTICYDNTRNRKGFLTERIFEAFYAKCIPVYWGALDIEKYVPFDCFIDRRKFTSNEELYFYLKSMDKKTYEAQIRAGQAYLQTPFVRENFSVDSFARTIMKAVLERAGS